MDRNREARRGSMVAALSRRRHRNHSLRDSPEEDMELHETTRLRDRDRGGSGKKDRDRMSRNKRRRAERLMHVGGGREEAGEESSEESVNDEDEDEDEYDDAGGAAIRMLPPPTTTSFNYRKSFPPHPPVVSNKQFRPLLALKVSDVPRKARSASTKRSHEWPSSCGVVGEQLHRQASTSPVRPFSAAPSPAPTSPSSSHTGSIRKKPRPNGPRLKPPKMITPTVKSSSAAAQDEIEIEIAEVLYGMMRQPQLPTKQEIAASDIHKSTGDAKSGLSSPPPPHSSSPFPPNLSSSGTSITVTVPKRKRPRVPVKHDEDHQSVFPAQNSAVSTASADQSMKIEAHSLTLERKSGSVRENGIFLYNSHPIPVPDAQSQPETIKVLLTMTETKPSVNEESESRNPKPRKEEEQEEARIMSKKESSSLVLRLDDNRGDMISTGTNKANSAFSENESHREEKKFQIDLMAPPPLRPSPERVGEVDFMSVDPKPTVIVEEMELKSLMTTRADDDKALKFGKEEPAELEKAGEKAKKEDVVLEEEGVFKKPDVVGSKERNIDLQLDLEKSSDRDSGDTGFSGSKLLPQHVAKQQQSMEKAAVQPSNVPLPVSMPAGWPGGLSQMGRYTAPLQGVVFMDGSTVPPAAMQPPQLLFNQPRPKKCATHCYIARNIYYHQQMSKMNPFWPVAAGSGAVYGAKHNPSAIPPEFHGGIPSRGANSTPDKGQGIATFPAQPGKEKPAQAASLMDAQRKQLMIQQALPPGAPSNIMHGPAFIFPLSQQQAAAAASVGPGSVKSVNVSSAALPSSMNATSVTGAATPSIAPTMSFNYPGNEPPYLAILPNNAYPFSVPAHVGAPPCYRGPHAQSLPYFSGSIYPSQMFHPSQLQQQHQEQQPPSQAQQSQQGHENPSILSGSSSSQKHLQNQQQRPTSSGLNGGYQGFPTSKNQSSQTLQMQQQQHQHQRQRQQNTHAPHQARQLEHEMGGEDSPSTADSRISRPNMYAQNFAIAMPPSNFGSMTSPMGGAAGAVASSGSDKKQQQGSKAGIEGSPAYAMSFALNGANPSTGLDMASLAHSQAIIQSLPEAARQGYQQFMAAAVQAQAAQQKKNYRHPDEGKSGGADSSNMEEERKVMTGKSATIAFSTDGSGSTISGNNVLDSTVARSLNPSSASGRASNSVMPVSASAVNASIPQQQFQQMRMQQQMQQQHQIQQQHQMHQQLQQQQMQQQQQQMQQQQQQHMFQLQKHQLQQNAVRTKTPATSNGSSYSDHLPPSSSMAAKFPNALSSFPHNLVQTTTSPSQSPQWMNSSRTTTSQVPASSLASSTSSSLKSQPQKQARTQQSHTQISFAANPKLSTQNQGPQPNRNQSPSPPIMVGSPTTTTSSMSKSAGGSPRTITSNSTGNKAAQASSLSSQQVKNPSSVPCQRSSPVGGRNVPSSLGNTHITSSSTGTKSQLTQQQQQQQHPVSKQQIQQAQLYYSSPYVPNPHSSHSNSTGGTALPSSGYYVPTRRRGDTQQQSSGTSSSGMLSLTPPVTLANNTGTTDPAKAVAAAAAAANNMKGGGLSSQTLIQHAQFTAVQTSGSHQLLPSGFPHVHTVPTVVQMKPAEQKKQSAGE